MENLLRCFLFAVQWNVGTRLEIPVDKTKCPQLIYKHTKNTTLYLRMLNLDQSRLVIVITAADTYCKILKNELCFVLIEG